MIDPWLLERLICPRCRGPVTLNREWLTCQQSHRYPVTDDIPVMVLDDVPQTHWVAAHALQHYADAAVKSGDPADATIDPVVQEAIGAASGNLYRHLIGRLPRYPIPHFPFEAPAGTLVCKRQPARAGAWSAWIHPCTVFERRNGWHGP